MKKRNLILAASLVAALTACGKKEEPAPVAPAPPTPAPDVTPAPPATTTPPMAPPATTNAPMAPPATTNMPATPAPGSSAPGATTTAAAGGADGAAIFNKTCALCHAAGVAGAPKPGDKADWGPRIAQGKETLYKHAIEGFTGQKGMMPPRGGGASLTDAEVKAAVDYMVAKSS